MRGFSFPGHTQTMRCLGLILLVVCVIAVAPAFAAGDSGDDTEATPAPAAAELEAAPQLDKLKIKPVPDPVLAQRIHAGIAATQRPALRKVTIRVEKGVVTMNGRLRTRQEKALAEAVARTLPGVRDVRSNISLEEGFRAPVPHGDRRSLVQMTVDDKLQRRVLRKLASISGVRVSQLQVEVYDGVVVIGGVVPEALHIERVRHSLTHIPDIRAIVLNLQAEQSEP